MNGQVKPRFHHILIAALAALSVAGLGAQLTDIGPWYKALVQPAWKPADFWFGPAWTTIFVLAATAGVMGWRAAPNATTRRWLLALFGLNAALNSLWSLLFFKLQRPDWALAEVGMLWLSIAALMWALRSYAPRASALLLPYLLWVSFASVLNLVTVQLNGPFG